MDYEDDWLFDSIKKYKKLYMYDLHKPVQAADWLTSQNVVVCISDKERHEILELSLPAQLCVEEENTGLTKDRDFQLLTGGFSDSCITSLYNLSHTRKVLACIKEDNSIETWQLPSDDSSTNVMEKVGIINCQTFSCHSSQMCSVDNEKLVFGSHLSGICVADLNTQMVISHTHESERNHQVSNMIHHNKCVLTSDKITGELFLVDPRLGVIKPQQVSDTCPAGVSHTWVLCEEVTGAEQGVIQMSGSGIIYVRDYRNLKHLVKLVKTNLKLDEDQKIQISRCPSNQDLLAVTGFSGCVQLYDQTKWTDGDVVTPVFTHEGHMAERDDPLLDITTNLHLWYPWKQNTLLSASNNGSLQIFQPEL